MDWAHILELLTNKNAEPIQLYTYLNIATLYLIRGSWDLIKRGWDILITEITWLSSVSDELKELLRKNCLHSLPKTPYFCCRPPPSKICSLDVHPRRTKFKDTTYLQKYLKEKRLRPQQKTRNIPLNILMKLQITNVKFSIQNSNKGCIFLFY